MIGSAIQQLVNGQNLSAEVTQAAFYDIMNGNATDAQIGAFMTAMRIKGESIDEITACAKVMREKCQVLKIDKDLLDIVGTGGDGANTFNVSTISSIVIASAGIPVAKHGNRAVSSKCGSADVLEALGVAIDIPFDACKKMLLDIDLCFMFAPLYHTSMKYAAGPRKELSMRTVFNILGPLANPACATVQLLGVYDERLVEPLAKVLLNLGIKRAMVVCGHDGLDEVSLCASTTICEVNHGKTNSFFLNPTQVDLPLCHPDDLLGGGPRENAEIAIRILKGEKGPKRDMVLLNSAICIYMFNNHVTLRECVKIAGNLIDSGKALAKLEQFVSYSRRLKEEATQ